VAVVGHFIAGQEVADASEPTAPVFDPARGEAIRTVSMASAARVQQAVDAASAALPGWASTPVPRRARVMFRFRDLLERNMDEIAAVLTEEHGKVLSDAKAEVARGLEVVEFVCGIPQLLKAESSQQVGSGIDTLALRQPLGVVAGITPFNFPVMVPLWMAPVALACGNTFVLKPSERDPSASLILARLLREAGLPDGAFNVVQGDRGTVEALIDAPAVQALSFVGSTPVAKAVYTRATARGIRAQALGGAKNHLVVLPDADLDQAADALVGAAFGAAGERCMAISVAVAVGDTAEPLLTRVLDKAKALRVRVGTDPQADLGPLITEAHAAKVRGYIDAGVSEGATLALDGRDVQVPGHPNGFCVGPTVFDHVSPQMTIYREEIFGPVLSVVRCDTFDDAVALTNGHVFGNGVSLFTRDGDAARTFVDRIEAGMVGINVPIPVPVAFHSFGGWKASLFGDHHVYGPEGVRFYTRLKTVTSRWPTGVRDGVQTVMPTSGD
jgi:malonate-semialdehyde dehydrogenase (acetylating)/methylmalonate-semialdehyde dehydrogenase